MNLSYNPTLLSGSQGLLIPYSASNGDNIFYINKEENYGILKDFVTGSISGSEFSPYVSQIGLYNDAGDLLAVAKMAAPMPLSTNTDMTFLVKYDTVWVDKPYFTPSPTPSPSPNCSFQGQAIIFIQPSPSPTPTVTPSISLPSTPSVTPTVTPSVSVTPTVTPSISITPTVTPSTTPPNQIVEFYGKLGATPSADDALIFYSTNNSTWYPVTVGPATASIDSLTCQSRGTISVPYGSNVYVGLRRLDGTTTVSYNAQLGTTCPTSFPTYCETGTNFQANITSATDIAITAYVTAGDLDDCP